MVIDAFVPLNESALPNLPVALQVALASVPVLALPDDIRRGRAGRLR